MTDVTTNTSNRRGLPGILLSFESRTNVKGAVYGHGRMSYNSKGRTFETTIRVGQYSESQKAAFASLSATAAGSEIDVFGMFEPVIINGERVGAVFNVVKAGGRPVRAAKAAAAA